MRRHSLYCMILLAAVLAAPSGRDRACAESVTDMARTRAQFIEWHTRDAIDAKTIESYVRTLGPEGSWPDVDYSSTERGGWLTYRHLSRTLAMAKAYRKMGHPLAGTERLCTAILRSLEHWTEKDYTNPNWWYPRIGVPNAVAPILIIMGEAVPPELRERVTQQILGRSQMGMTGQNKVWVAGIALMKGLLSNDPALMRQARDQIFSELRVTTQEGIQPDYSFHQHGPQQQWGNYGGAFGADMICWTSILRDTRYGLESSRFDVLRHYLREGSAWILWKGRMDISGCGRQIFRNCQSSKGRAILRQLERMASIDPCEPERYARLITSTGRDGVNRLVGHKHFWRSDIGVHRRPTWYASVKMSSTRVIGAETCNGENMRGLHLGDGVTYFLRTGQEYEDLFPVWDWRRLPGTTCRQDRGSLVPNSRACRGRSDFVGGVTDGRRGVAALEYIRDGLRARKAWFFLDEAVVCLGTGIAGETPERVLTSINQCALAGPVTLGANGRVRKLQEGEPFVGKLDWVHHDGIGYILVGPQTAAASAVRQEGDWHSVHSRERRDRVERAVFSLWIDHGARPRDAQYAYIVVPDVDAAAMPSLSSRLPARIVRQSRSALAVSDDDGKSLLAAFFEPCRPASETGSSVAADTPCLMICDQADRNVSLHVADPTHRRKEITLRLAGRYLAPAARYDSAARETEVTIALPSEGLAGQTVSLELRRWESACATEPSQRSRSSKLLSALE